MGGEKRVLYYDLLNIAACIAVIALHHNGLVHIFQGGTKFGKNVLWLKSHSTGQFRYF